MEYIVDDKKLDAFTFIAFVKQVWQGNYDIEKTQCALSQTINITAYENEARYAVLHIRFRCSNLDFCHYGAEKDSDRNEEGREMVSRKPV